jgi:hypothetical protein
MPPSRLPPTARISPISYSDEPILDAQLTNVYQLAESVTLLAIPYPWYTSM